MNDKLLASLGIGQLLRTFIGGRSDHIIALPTPYKAALCFLTQLPPENVALSFSLVRIARTLENRLRVRLLHWRLLEQARDAVSCNRREKSNLLADFATIFELQR